MKWGKVFQVQVPIRIHMYKDHSYTQRQTDCAQFHQSGTQTGSDSTCKGSPHLPNTCPTKLHHSRLCRHVLRQDRRTPMHQCKQDFLSTLPSHLKMLLHYPEKNARFGNKSKYAFLGIHHSQTHRTAWLLWSPVQEMGVKGGGGKFHNLIEKQHKQSWCNRVLSGLSSVM